MFEENLKRLMQEKGITQQQLGEAIGLSGPAISMMISGVRKPSFESLTAICKELRTTPNVLMGFEDEISEQDRAILKAIKSVSGLQKQAESNQDTPKQTTTQARKEQEQR